LTVGNPVGRGRRVVRLELNLVLNAIATREPKHTDGPARQDPGRLPSRTVLIAKAVARATAATPPQPITSASDHELRGAERGSIFEVAGDRQARRDVIYVRRRPRSDLARKWRLLRATMDERGRWL